MKPFLAILTLAVHFATSPLPPLEQVVVEHIEAIELVTIPDDDTTEIYFIDRVKGHMRYIDYRWFHAGTVPFIEPACGGWRMEWWDENGDCYRTVYAGVFVNTVCDRYETPLFHLVQGGFWRPHGLAQPAGRWW